MARPDWGEQSRSLAFEAGLAREGFRIYLLLNAYWGPLGFELPPTGDGDPWRRGIDTSLEAPLDVVPWEAAPPLAEPTYVAAARSVVVLFAEIGYDGARGAAVRS